MLKRFDVAELKRIANAARRVNDFQPTPVFGKMEIPEELEQLYLDVLHARLSHSTDKMVMAATQGEDRIIVDEYEARTSKGGKLQECWKMQVVRKHMTSLQEQLPSGLRLYIHAARFYSASDCDDVSQCLCVVWSD